MFRITFLVSVDPKIVNSKTKVLARTLSNETTVEAALKQAHELMNKRTPDQKKKATIVSVKVEQQATGAIKWD